MEAAFLEFTLLSRSLRKDYLIKTTEHRSRDLEPVRIVLDDAAHNTIPCVAFVKRRKKTFLSEG